MSAPLTRTSTPGIFKRGRRYVVVFRDPGGRQRKRFARTLAEARELKATLTADVKRGEWRDTSDATFAACAAEWIDGYQGRTSRGIRETTKQEYRRDLGLDADGNATGDGAVAFFGRMKLTAIEPRDLKRYAATLAARGLKPNSVRLAIAPVRAMLADAFEEGLIRSNPAAGVRFVQPHNGTPDDERVKALTEEELRRLLGELPDEWRTFFEFLAQTGLRIGEAVALVWGDIDFARRRVQVRRRLYRGTVAPPKSKYGRRDVPISKAMARTLSARWNETRPGPDEPLFASATGTPLDPSNVAARILKPAARRAGVGWAGFHTFRHSCATNLFRSGKNPKQVQGWLGHHSPAFTMAVYVHLLPDDLGESPFDEEPEPVEPESVEVEEEIAA